MNEDCVIRAYRALLHRDPESPDVIAAHLALHADEAALRAALKASAEYNTRLTAIDPEALALDGSNPFAHLAASFDPVALIDRHLAPALHPVPGRLVNAFGVVIDPAYVPSVLAGREGDVEPPPAPNNWHADVAEFAAALRAVQRAGETFAMAELGCGWGCWMSLTGVVARRTGRLVRLIGVEADPAHLDFARRCMAENGFIANEFRLIHGVAAADPGVALFPRQDAPGGDWGREPILGAGDVQRAAARASGAAMELPTTPLAEVIADLERLDLLHVDIQGGEEALLTAAMPLLDARVAHVCVGTHSRAIEGALWRAFTAAEWRLEVERPAIYALGEREVRLMCDGVQGWRNPRFA